MALVAVEESGCVAQVADEIGAGLMAGGMVGGAKD